MQKGLCPTGSQQRGFANSRMSSLSWGLRVDCAVAVDAGEALRTRWVFWMPELSGSGET